jgi:monoamine oxidase
MDATARLPAVEAPLATRRSAAVDAAVVGAGISGLTAAHTLTAAGLSVTVLEARDRVGGRLLSSARDDEAVDLGATWFWPNEPAVGALAEDLKLPVFPQALAGDALFETDQRGPRRLAGNPLDVPSSRFADGAQVLALRLADRLPPGTLHLGDPVSGVRIDDDRDAVIVDAASGTVAARHVVLALPPALAVEAIAFTPALPRPIRDLAARTAVWMGGVVKAVAVYDEPFWRDAGLAGAAMSHLGPFRELHDHSGPGGRPAALFGFAAAAQFNGAPPERIAAAFRRQLARLFGPAAAAPRAVHVTDWSRETRTSPRAPSPAASTASYGHPLFRQPVAGRIHWASTETAPDYAGHIEGAIRAGTRAARGIIHLAGGTIPAVRDDRQEASCTN